MSSSSPKPKWSARMGSVMRRTSSVLTISRPASAASERDTDNSSLSSSTRGRASSIIGSPPLPSVITPSPIAESPLREAAAEAQESVGPSPLAQPITSSEVVTPSLPPPVEEAQSPTEYIPPPVIDSTVGNPGAFTDVTDDLPQPDIAQDPQSVAPVEPHVEPATLNPPEPEKPEAMITEELVEEPTSYFAEPMAESIKDFDPADNTPEFSETVMNDNVISPEPQNEQNGEASEYYHGDDIPATGEVVPENVDVVFPEPNLGSREEPEAHHDDDAVPVVTQREIQEEPPKKSDPILIPVPVPVPNYDMPSFPMNLGSEREVWGGEHDHGAYPSSVPVVDPTSEDVKRVERSPAPSIRFVDFLYPFFFRELDPKIIYPHFRMAFSDPFADPIAPRITVSQPVLDMPQYVNLEFFSSPTPTNRRFTDRNLLTIITKNRLRHIAMVRLSCLYHLSLITTHLPCQV
jgi:hypothetical protein